MDSLEHLIKVAKENEQAKLVLKLIEYWNSVEFKENLELKDAIAYITK